MLFGSKFLGLYWRDEHNFFQKNISSFVLIMEVKHDVWHVQNVHIILILIKPYLCHVLKLLYLLHFSTYLFRLFLLVTSLQDECQIERKVASIIFVEYNKLNISSRCIINKVFKTSVYSQFCQACGCGVCVYVCLFCTCAFLIWYTVFPMAHQQQHSPGLCHLLLCLTCQSAKCPTHWIIHRAWIRSWPALLVML